MLKFLHTSDWHLGRLLFGKSLLEDQAYLLDGLLDLCAKVRPHGLLIAGDIFDRAFAPEAAISLFDRFLERVVLELKIPVFIIPGNHDSSERLGFAARMLRAQGLTIFSRVDDAFHPVRLQGDDGVSALVYGIPFVEPAITAHALGDASLRTPEQAVGAICDKIRAQHPANELSVLLCHAFVVGAETSESERDIFVGGSSYVPSTVFRDFSYTALGHLHKPQTAGSNSIRYSGSLFTYSKSEVTHQKSVLEVQLQASSCQVIAHQLPRLRSLRYIEGEYAQILKSAESEDENQRNDYVLCGLTDRGPIIDAALHLRSFYPHLLNVSRVSFGSDALPQLREAVSVERMRASELDLFAEFVQATTGSEMSSDERLILSDVLREMNLDPLSKDISKKDEVAPMDVST